MEAPHVSPPCHVWCPLVYWKWRYNIFNLSRELTRTRNWRIVWRYGSKLVNYITTLPNLLAICEVVLEIWWLYFITWSCKTIWLKSHVILREVFPQAKSPSGAKFGSHKPCGRNNIVVLVCHLISQDHTMKKSCDYMGGSSWWSVTTLPNLVARFHMLAQTVILMPMEWKRVAYYVNKLHNVCHTRSKQ